MPNPNPLQTKTKIKAKILVPLVVAAALILGRRAMIFEMYETLYGRAGDVKGIEYWDKIGLSFDILKQKFLTSDEFVKAVEE
jgi:hypothetical protein